MAARNKPTGKPVEVQAVEPLKANGKRVEPGGLATVPESVAAELFALGHARPGAEAKAEAEAKAKAEAEANGKPTGDGQQQLPQT